MSVYRRGDVWWYKFWFNGQLIHESSKSDSKTVANDAVKARRRELEQAYNRIPKRERMPLFSHASAVWLANKAGLAEKSRPSLREPGTNRCILTTIGNPKWKFW